MKPDKKNERASGKSLPGGGIDKRLFLGCQIRECPPYLSKTVGEKRSFGKRTTEERVVNYEVRKSGLRKRESPVKFCEGRDRREIF